MVSGGGRRIHVIIACEVVDGLGLMVWGFGLV